MWGTCWEGDQAPALWPWTQVLRTLLNQGLDEEAVAAELAVVVPERAAPPGAATAAAGDTGRLQLFDEGGAGEADRLRVSTPSAGSSPARRPGSPPSYCSRTCSGANGPLWT